MRGGLRAMSALLLGIGLVTPIALAAPATAAAGGAAPSAGVAPRSGTVTLITGDQVQVGAAAGRSGVLVNPADRGDATAPVSFSTYVWHGDTYVVPSDAMVYLNHPLDMGLFDVSALIRDGLTGQASLPLTVGYSGVAPQSLPAMTLGSPQGGQVDASEEPFRAAEFGQALSTQLQADVALAHGQQPATPSDLFAGIDSITLNASGPSSTGTGSAPPRGTVRMQTLTLNTINRDGVPAANPAGNSNGTILVVDVDHPDWFAAMLPVTDTQNWSVPAGDYEVRAFVWTWFQKQICFTVPTGQQCSTVWDYDMSFVWQPQVHVNRDTTVTIDARTANPIPTPTTPDSDTSSAWRKAGCCVPQLELVSDRVNRDGSDIPYYWQSGAHAIGPDGSSLEMFAAPSAPVTTGDVHFYTYLRLESPSTHHVYDLQYPSEGTVPSSFASSVAASDLAAIPTSYDSEIANRMGGQARFGYEPWEYDNVRQLNRISQPLQRTEYVLADAGPTLWQDAATMNATSQYPFGDQEVGPYTTYQPRPQQPVTWFAAPRHPGIVEPGPAVPVAIPGTSGMACPACRSANQIGVDIKPYVGGDPQQYADALDTGNPFARTHITDSISLNYYENGTLVTSEDKTSDPTLGTDPVVVPADAASAQDRIDYTVDRDTPWTPLSPHTSTSWTFTSQAPSTTDTLPANWSCGQLSGGCAVLPLLFVDYSLPLDDANSAPAQGPYTFTIRVYHQPHADSTAAIGVPTVSVSFDDGATWQAATSVADAGGGTYRVGVTHPDPITTTGFVSLRVQAADSAGSGIDQTIIRAYALQGVPGSPYGSPAPGSGSGGSGGAFSDAIPACQPGPAPYAACNALLRTDASGQPVFTPGDAVSPSTAPPGLAPSDLQGAYNLPANGGSGQTVAVVDAAGDPNIAGDLATYRSEYGLPPCTTDSGCLRVVGPDGNPPPANQFYNQSWGVETALDLDMVSAACPSCHILLVVAPTNSVDSLAKAVNAAVRLGANAVSNSYGIYEIDGIQPYAADYVHPGVPIVASSGDNGYGLNGTLGGTQFPASVASVIAVGGTSLTRDPGSARGWSETAWSGSGSGCSAYFAKPAWQHDAHCGMRTVADIAAVADPKTGVAVYDSYLAKGAGWLVVGGTSAASPFIAGVYGLAGNAAQADDPSHLYANSGELNDVTSGSNGTCGQSNYLCQAKHNYDGPTGLGTPDGVGAF